MPLNRQKIKSLRRRSHCLKPVVMVGDKGLSDSVLKEIDRALHDHVLIKVKLPAGDRQARSVMQQRIVDELHCTSIHSIGRVACFYRLDPDSNPRLHTL